MGIIYMVKVQLDGIPQTLLLPLLTRATFSKQNQPIFLINKL